MLAKISQFHYSIICSAFSAYSPFCEINIFKIWESGEIIWLHVQVFNNLLYFVFNLWNLDFIGLIFILYLYLKFPFFFFVLLLVVHVEYAFANAAHPVKLTGMNVPTIL
jgi:hypothetical protein